MRRFSYLQRAIVLASLGLFTYGSLPAQESIGSMDLYRLSQAREAYRLGSGIGVLSALQPTYVDLWRMPLEGDEASFLDGVARAGLGTAEAETVLLQFVESHPHSALVPYAEARLGEWYYVRGMYGSAVARFARVDTDLLPDRMSAAVTYYHAYGLMQEGREAEALRLFEPVVYSADFRSDALFYAGYLSVRSGDYDRGVGYLRQVQSHAQYGPYAEAYMAEVDLVERAYGRSYDRAAGLLSRMGTSLSADLSGALQRTAGLAASALGRHSDALHHLLPLVERDATPGRLELLTLGRTLREVGRDADAVPYLSRVDEGQADFMAQLARYYMGLSLLSSGDLTAAEANFDRAAEIAAYAPLTETAAFDAALSSYARRPGRVGVGTQRLIAFYDRYPQSDMRSRLLGYLSDAYLHDSDLAAVQRELESIRPLPRELHSVRESLKLKRATKLLSDGDSEAAEPIYMEVIEHSDDPHRVAMAYFGSGEAAYRQGNFGRAAERMQAYLSRVDAAGERGSANEANARYTLAFALFNLKQYAEAERQLQQYLESTVGGTSDRRTAALNRLGDLSLQRRAYDEALGRYRMAREAKGQESDYALFQIGMVQGLKKEYDAKIATMNEVGRLYPTSAYRLRALLESGHTSVLLHRHADARRAFEQVAAEGTQHDDAGVAELQLAQIFRNEDQAERAFEHYERVIRRYPRSDEAKSALEDLKQLAVTTGRVDEYARLVERVSSSTGESALTGSDLDDMYYGTAASYAALGKTEEALAALDKYLAMYPQGAHKLEAYHLRAYTRSSAGDHAGAVSDAMVVAEGSTQDPVLRHSALLLMAQSYDQLREPGRAAQAYYRSAQSATDEAERGRQLDTALDRAMQSDSNDFVYQLATQVAEGAMKVAEQMRERIIAKACDYLARIGEVAKAQRMAAQLSKATDPANRQMAQVVTALDRFAQAKYADVAKEMERMIAGDVQDEYWYARGIILRADAAYAMGEVQVALDYLGIISRTETTERNGIYAMALERIAKYSKK